MNYSTLNNLTPTELAHYISIGGFDTIPSELVVKLIESYEEEIAGLKYELEQVDGDYDKGFNEAISAGINALENLGYWY